MKPKSISLTYSDMLYCLHDKRAELDKVIEQVVELKRKFEARPVLPDPLPKKRGRKSMGKAEREEVRQRMLAHAAKKKAEDAAD